MQQNRQSDLIQPDMRKTYYSALLSRDTRFDGRFFAGVLTTGVYCRPVCPARKPKFENCRFYKTAAEAQENGFRPCKRCRPETAPTSPAWTGTEATVSRAMRLITAGAMENDDIPKLADKLGVSTRHLRRLFEKHIGVSPKQFAATHRLNMASQLLMNSNASITEIAMAAGFKSLRRFNSAFQQIYKTTPSEFRQRKPRNKNDSLPVLTLKLFYKTPYDWDNILSFLSKRAISGIEDVDQKQRSYTRTFQINASKGLIVAQSIKGKNAIGISVYMDTVTPLLGMVQRMKNLFDLETDSTQILNDLQEDKRLKPHLNFQNGIHMPGGWDIFEVGIRAIIGQQISVPAAKTLLGRLVHAYGTDMKTLNGKASHSCQKLFPLPHHIMDADIETIGMPLKRAETIRQFAGLMTEINGANHLPDENLMNAIADLPGIGPWTLNYIRMRGLKDPDAFPVGDVALLKAAKTLGIAETQSDLTIAAQQWKPWRSYATAILWNSLAHTKTG